MGFSEFTADGHDLLTMKGGLVAPGITVWGCGDAEPYHHFCIERRDRLGRLGGIRMDLDGFQPPRLV